MNPPGCPRCGSRIGPLELCTNPSCPGSVVVLTEPRCRCGRVAPMGWCRGCGSQVADCPCTDLRRRARVITATPRQRGTNPRRQGTNPRARWDSPRQLREMALASAGRADEILEHTGNRAATATAASVLAYRAHADPDCWPCAGRGWIWAPPPSVGRRIACPECLRDAATA